ncbi:hypothetical protein MMC16_004250 [Acarospora aff. strigata]|nr:hypothetical protein [Acarospora aff. strigata]
MYFSKIAVFSFFVALAAAAPVAEAEAAPELSVRAPENLKRGFGCPFNRQQCNDHCISLQGGRTGGYCAGTFRTTCTCVFG